MKKFFVLDTNVLLHEPESIYAFEDNQVVIPIDVLEELDKFKGENTELGRNARETIRILDKLRKGGRLGDGVAIDGAGGMLRIDTKPISLADVGLEKDTPDNRILSIAWKLKEQGQTVVLISKDISVRIKCDALGLKAEDYEHSKVNPERLYTGWRELEVAPEELDRFFEQKRLPIKLELFPHEFVLLRDRDKAKRTAIGRRGARPDEAVPLRHQPDAVSGIAPRNLEQRMALELLLDDDIALVTFIGRAGTGKTLLALAAGLQKVIRETKYEKLLVSRPIMPLGRDIGYLPGSKDEKLEQWMKPIFDNLKYILRERKEPGEVNKRINELLSHGVIEMEALTYIRGRSISNQFLIVDECQNLTPHEIKTIISRAGHDTKLVLTGDPYQIDNPYLDSASNGLSYVAERMKDQQVAGAVLLTRSERSKLASVASEIL